MVERLHKDDHQSNPHGDNVGRVFINPNTAMRPSEYGENYDFEVVQDPRWDDEPLRGDYPEGSFTRWSPNKTDEPPKSGMDDDAVEAIENILSGISEAVSVANGVVETFYRNGRRIEVYGDGSASSTYEGGSMEI